MSAERLKALVEQGNLINLNIVSDSLGTLLNEIAQMLVDQQRQINSMKKDVTDKLNKTDYNQFVSQWRVDRDMILRSFPNFDATIAKLTKDMEHKNEDLRSHIDQAVDQALISVDTRFMEKMSSLENDNLIAQHKIDSFEQKYKNITQQVTKADIDALKKRLLKVEGDVAALDAPKLDQKIIDELREEMEKRFDEMQTTMTPREESSNSSQTRLETTAEIGMPRFGDVLETIEPIEENEVPSDDIAEIKKSIESIEAKIEEQNKNLITRSSWRSEVTLVERMFEKMRMFVTQLQDEVAAAVKGADECVKKADLDDFIEAKVNTFLESKKIIATGPPLRCIGLKSGEVKTPKKTADSSTLSPLPVLLIQHRQKDQN